MPHPGLLGPTEHFFASEIPLTSITVAQGVVGLAVVGIAAAIGIRVFNTISGRNT